MGPTLAELLGAEAPDRWDGRSFASEITETAAGDAGSGTNGGSCGDEWNGRSELIVSQCAHTCQRGVRFDNWMYVRTYHDGFRLLPDEMLFDIEVDSYEQTDVAMDRPEVCADAARRLSLWHDRMMAGMEYSEDPMQTVLKEGGPYHNRVIPPEYVRRLEATDRGEALRRLREKHPRAFER